MGTQWTNKYAILRDLSYAQGRKVPADISKGSVGAGEKPPVLNVEEETEEEYIKSGGDGELHTEPDLFMIKHMLNWVRDVDVDNVDDIDNEKVIEISKPNTLHHIVSDNVLVNTNLNPLCTEFVPRNLGSGDNNVTCLSNLETKSEDLPKPKKKRRERNAAIVSLLEKEQQLHIDNPTPQEKGLLCDAGNKKNATIVANNLNWTKQNITANKKDECHVVKLLKPNDFISDKTVTEAVDKVTEWLQGPTAHKSAKINPMTLSPSSMFKKKQPKAQVLERRSDASSIKSSDSDTPRMQPNNTFVPSTQANEYYKKYVERSQMQKIIQEGIWEKAERVMKEIDAKRLTDAQDEISRFLVESTTPLEEVGNTPLVEHNRGLSQGGHAGSEPIDVKPLVDVDTEQVDVDCSKQIIDNSENDGQDSKELKEPMTSRLKGLDLVRLPKHRHDLPEECKVCVVLAKYKPSQLN